jgi:hypothetical protein
VIPRRHRRSLVTATGIALAWASAAQALGQATSAAATTLAARDRASTLYALLVIALGLVMAFVLTALLILRAGRVLRARQTPHERTSYVDAWSQARVSESELAAFRDDAPPDASPPEPPPPPEPKQP